MGAVDPRQQRDQPLQPARRIAPRLDRHRAAAVADLVERAVGDPHGRRVLARQPGEARRAQAPLQLPPAAVADAERALVTVLLGARRAVLEDGQRRARDAADAAGGLPADLLGGRLGGRGEQQRYERCTCEPGTMSSAPSGQRTHALCPPS